MALLQFRDKVSKVSAIRAFTEDDSTFQYIHSNFILVCVNPNKVKVDIKKNIKRIDKFFEKYKSVIVLSTIFLMLLMTYVGMIIR